MITSDQIISLSEKYTTSGKIYGHYLEIFENPDRSDLLKLAELVKENTNRRLETIRFVAVDKTKTVYICDGYSNIHQDMRDLLKLPAPGYTGSIDGIAKVYGGKAVMSELSNISSEEAVRSKWTWVDKYISGCSAKIRE